MSRSQHVAAPPRADALLHGTTTCALLFLPALICFFRDVVDDPDVWWHLRTGEWILTHRAWPTADPFSSYGAGQAWAAYSWLPELMLWGLYQVLGLRGLVLYTAGLSVAIVAALHGMVRRMGTGTNTAVVLTLAAALGLITIQTPRPWLFSILLFVLELDLLLTAGRTGSRRLLWWLVPLFLVWANMHIQFVVGLAVLGAAVIEPVLARFVPLGMADEQSPKTPFGHMLPVFAACVAATLVNPYGYHLYEVALALVGQSGLWNLIQELGPMRFRSVENWTVLAVTVAAAFALGWRRRVRLLLALLFVMAVYVSFRSQRDVWLVLIAGLTVLAYVGPRAAEKEKGDRSNSCEAPFGPSRQIGPAPFFRRRSLNWVVAGTVALLVVGGSLALSESKLKSQVARALPVQAARFIAEEQPAGPMFNPFDWGGYLIFHLPEVPVSIDGRTMVHGEARILRHAATLRGKGGWRDDPELSRAGFVLLPGDGALASLLEIDDRFRVLYRDPLAVVFSRETNLPLAEKPNHTQLAQTRDTAE
ncbi:MAG TPA: hypothetical protein VMY37_04700 [Thermoguttaceae bacterium]|nr:hypothetical protein [Thermoguttaceae bacterium]